MTEVIETHSLEYGKSQYLIDLVLHKDSKSHFIKIVQSVNQEGQRTKDEIKIHPCLFEELVICLQQLHRRIPQREYNSKETLSVKRRKEILKAYLNGTSIEDLVLSFDKRKEVIEQVLRNLGAPIVDQSPPPPTKKNWRAIRRYNAKRKSGRT